MALKQEHKQTLNTSLIVGVITILGVVFGWGVIAEKMATDVEVEEAVGEAFDYLNEEVESVQLEVEAIDKEHQEDRETTIRETAKLQTAQEMTLELLKEVREDVQYIRRTNGG